MKKIKLTQGKYALVDDVDFDNLNSHKWYFNSTGYACRDKREGGKRKCYLMHREIMGANKGMDVDHINHNTIDNRRSNLRNVSRSQNNMNRIPKKNGSSKYKGLCWDKSKSKWMVNIKYDGIDRFLGYFESEVEAANKYNSVAKDKFGEFAYLNPV